MFSIGRVCDGFFDLRSPFLENLKRCGPGRLQLFAPTLGWHDGKDRAACTRAACTMYVSGWLVHKVGQMVE